MELLNELRNIPEPIVLTHDGRFHADELLAIAILQEALGRPVNIRRSRDSNAWTHADLLIDVGGAVNPYDHHHRNNKYHPNGIPYASCGLILDAVEPDAKLRNQLYCDMLYTVEWEDNTVQGEVRSPNWDLKPNLLAWVSHFQPMKEENPEEYTLRKYFDKALEMVTDIYRRVRKSAIIKIRNREIKDTTTYDVRDGVLWLKDNTTTHFRYCNEHPEIKATVSLDKGTYVIRPLHVGPNDPCLRATFPSVWYGLSDFDLQRASRINGVIWCSNSGDRLRCKDYKSVQQALRYLS